MSSTQSCSFEVSQPAYWDSVINSDSVLLSFAMLWFHKARVHRIFCCSSATLALRTVKVFNISDPSTTCSVFVLISEPGPFDHSYIIVPISRPDLSLTRNRSLSHWGLSIRLLFNRFQHVFFFGVSTVYYCWGLSTRSSFDRLFYVKGFQPNLCSIASLAHSIKVFQPNSYWTAYFLHYTNQAPVCIPRW